MSKPLRQLQPPPSLSAGQTPRPLPPATPSVPFLIEITNQTYTSLEGCHATIGDLEKFADRLLGPLDESGAVANNSRAGFLGQLDLTASSADSLHRRLAKLNERLSEAL